MAVLLGAAAGAGAGYAASQKRKCRHECHQPVPQPSCNCNCGQDIGEQLIFDISMGFDVNVFLENALNPLVTGVPGPGRLKITSFVVDPKGCMTTGKTEIIKLQREEIRFDGEIEIPIDISFPSGHLLVYEDLIAISDPIYGAYNFGLQIQFDNLPSLSFSLILGQVKSSKTQTTTTIPISLPLSLGVTGLTFTQAHGEYYYAPKDGVPSIRDLIAP